MKPRPWAQARAAERKRLKTLPACETPGCDGRVYGYVPIQGRVVGLCPKCAKAARSNDHG